MTKKTLIVGITLIIVKFEYQFVDSIIRTSAGKLRDYIPNTE